MTTALKTIERAMRLIGVKAEGQPVSIEQAQDALDTLNQIGREWRRNYSVSFEFLESLESSLISDPVYDSAFEYELAVREATGLGIPVDLNLANSHKETINAMLSDSIGEISVNYPSILPKGTTDPDEPAFFSGVEQND